jgi:hypothetical protein
MKAFLKVLTTALLLFSFLPVTFCAPTRAGFYIPDHIQEVSFRYRSIDKLIILPVIINDSIQLNLILDTGCRNLVLFGKRFQKLFTLEPDKKVQFSGLGSGRPVNGALSLKNKVSINDVLGENIPVIIIPNQNLFSVYNNVHGVIGYDIFTKFEVELNPSIQLITFRPAITASLNEDYISVPIRVTDARPIIDCRVVLDKNQTHVCDLMIDTGSTLGLLLKTTDLNDYKVYSSERVIGRGLNGDIAGFETTTEKLLLSTLEMTHLRTGIIHSPWHNHASIGMDVLKDYIFVLNYCKGYAGFRKV